MARIRLGLGLGIVLAVGMGIVACADDNPVATGPDGPDGAVEASKNDGSGIGDQDSGNPDTGTKDAGTDAKDADADAAPLPGVVSDLVGAAETHTSVKLTWTAPPDYTGNGTVAYYEIRWSATPITNEAEFLAATELATPPAPEAPGTAQTAIIEGLTAATQYYVALRAQYDNDAFGPLSNVAVVTTKDRATLLISEIAPKNTVANGGDFVELVATKAGHAGGLVVYTGFNAMLHTVGPLDVQVGDRIVIHTSGLPGPMGFAQEDTTKNKTSSTAAHASANAYDVYSPMTDLLITAGTIIVAEPGNILAAPDLMRDVVPYADRSVTEPNEDMLPAMWGCMFADAGGSWPFALTEEGWQSLSNLCDVYVDALDASGDETTACGGAGAGLSAGESLQRKGTVDTNTAADFAIAPQTPGAAN